MSDGYFDPSLIKPFKMTFLFKLKLIRLGKKFVQGKIEGYEYKGILYITKC